MVSGSWRSTCARSSGLNLEAQPAQLARLVSRISSLRFSIGSSRRCRPVYHRRSGCDLITSLQSHRWGFQRGHSLLRGVWGAHNPPGGWAGKREHPKGLPEPPLFALCLAMNSAEILPLVVKVVVKDWW